MSSPAARPETQHPRTAGARTTGPKISRRRFLGQVGAAGIGAVGLSACVSSSTGRSVDLGEMNRLSVLNWPDYIDADENDDVYYPNGTLDRMAAERLIVAYDPRYVDNVSGFELVFDEAIANQPPRWDIVVVTNWRAAEMINNGWAEPLPIELIPNHSNIDPAYLTNSWDRGCRFQMPWQAGITGIAYDPALTGRPLNSVADLFDPAFAGRVGFIGEMREAVGLVMLGNGDDPSRPTVSAAEAALDKIVSAQQSGQVGAFTFNEFAPMLNSGELVAAMAWSGDVALLQAERPDIEFVIPDEGAIQWFDTMVIPKGSSAIGAAGRFMNFVYDPANAAQITEWVSYISPVLGVQEQLNARGGFSAKLARSPVLFPDGATRNRLFTWGELDAVDEIRIDTHYAELVQPS